MSEFNKRGDPLSGPKNPYIHDEFGDPNYYDLQEDKPKPFLKGQPEKFQPPQKGHDDLYRVGDEDLFPGGVRDPRGNLVGPHHPIFGPEVNDPYFNDPTHDKKDDIRRPKNARFDPYGPPEPDHISPNRTNYAPNPDHEKPPQFYSRDMYM